MMHRLILMIHNFVHAKIAYDILWTTVRYVQYVAIKNKEFTNRNNSFGAFILLVWVTERIIGAKFVQAQWACTNFAPIIVKGSCIGLTSSKSDFIQPSVTLCVQVQLFSHTCQTVSVQPAIGVSSVTPSSNLWLSFLHLWLSFLACKEINAM